MKISDGQFKLRAVFNTGKTVGCRDFDLSVVDGKSHVLVGFIPTTAGNQTVWKKVDASQILPLKGVNSYYCYPQTVKLPATLGELWKELYGHVQPFAHREQNGVRFVQVGDTIYHSSPGGKPWKYTTDLLNCLAELVLGRDWILSESRKPPEDQHQIVQLHSALFRQLKNASTDHNGDFVFSPCGAANYFYSLAYDLFVLQDVGLLNESVLQRLKDRQQFQGARHEIFVAATFARAGFRIEYEDESDGTTKHSEFLATHADSGATVAVEAKSRHRQGVLNFDAGGKRTSNPKADVIKLLNKALSKATLSKANQNPITKPYVIFIDLNLPPSAGSAFEKPWFKDLKSGIDRQLGEATPAKPDVFNMLVFTNHPFHYSPADEPSPQVDVPLALFSMHAKHPIERAALDLVYHAAANFGNIPRGFPILPDHAADIERNSAAPTGLE
jgi:hypothetical protein